MSEKLRDTPYFKYLAEILDKTDVDSEQWDALNGAMHQMEDQEAENDALREQLRQKEGELERARGDKKLLSKAITKIQLASYTGKDISLEIDEAYVVNVLTREKKHYGSN